jgi:hypothetical protein
MWTSFPLLLLPTSSLPPPPSTWQTKYTVKIPYVKIHKFDKCLVEHFFAVKTWKKLNVFTSFPPARWPRCRPPWRFPAVRVWARVKERAREGERYSARGREREKRRTREREKVKSCNVVIFHTNTYACTWMQAYMNTYIRSTCKVTRSVFRLTFLVYYTHTHVAHTHTHTHTHTHNSHSGRAWGRAWCPWSPSASRSSCLGNIITPHTRTDTYT